MSYTKDVESSNLKSISNDKIVPSAWMNILAAVEVGVDEVTLVVFCDKDGFDLAPSCMVPITQTSPNHMNLKKETIDTIDDKDDILYIKDEVSIRERMSTEKVSDYSFDEKA